jgi:hypothetical protein
MPVPKRVTKGCPSLNKPENKTTSPVPQLELRNGVQVPQLGLGVFLAGQGIQTEQAVLWALEAGYRHIDTAAVYGNEKEVGLALNASGVPRREIFLTGKIWNEHIRKRLTRAAFFQTLENLQTEYLDLCLLHWPVAGTRAAWETLEELYAEGRIRAIGVSNFLQHPALNLLAQHRRRRLEPPGRSPGSPAATSGSKPAGAKVSAQPGPDCVTLGHPARAGGDS